jgi:hypothetical protein
MDNEKELERLKWDYWNKSKLFKLVWRYFHAIKLNRNNPASNPYLNEVKQLKNGIYSPVQLGADTRKYRLYFYFHEYTPENADFDKYWNFEQERKSKPPFNKPYKRIYVEDYSELIENDFEYAINQFKRENNRNPKINEVKEYLS